MKVLDDERPTSPAEWPRDLHAAVAGQTDEHYRYVGGPPAKSRDGWDRWVTGYSTKGRLPLSQQNGAVDCSPSGPKRLPSRLESAWMS